MKLDIPDRFLRPSVRSNRVLTGSDISDEKVSIWTTEDRPFLLLDLPQKHVLPRSIIRYLDTQEGLQIRTRYKCRTREPWYCVPDVRVPDAFLSIMSSAGPRLVGNSARCVCTNSVHAVTLRNGLKVSNLVRKWKDPLTQLSCEVEGHHLSGGMLKVEPVEARNILIVSDHRKTYFFGLSPTGHRSRQPRLWRGIGGNGSVQRLNRPQIEHRQRVGERRGAGELIVPPP